MFRPFVEMRPIAALTRCLALAAYRHHDCYSYALPYRFGERYVVGQGYGGKVSHRHEDFYSLDFNMPERVVICASREGQVVDVVDNHKTGGWDKSYLPKCNLIRIAHRDGSTAVYAHLVYHGSWVSIGDVIRRGEPIGLSGNTGYSQGPHLHFHVESPYSGQRIPTRFATCRSEGQTLQAGRTYAHPGDESWLMRGVWNTLGHLLTRFDRNMPAKDRAETAAGQPDSLR